eukprot:SAG11_NODE_10584_length_819_cov_1.197222_2_plen_118_part_01
MFDSMPKLSSSKATDMWRKCHAKIGELIDIINDAGIILEEDEPQRLMDEFSAAHEMADEDILAEADGTARRVTGNNTKTGHSLRQEILAGCEDGRAHQVVELLHAGLKRRNAVLELLV